MFSQRMMAASLLTVAVGLGTSLTSCAPMPSGMAAPVEAAGAPSESGPVTPVGRFLGRTLSMLLAPIQQILAIVAMFLVLSTILFLADRYRLYDDRLVDTTVTIVGRTRRCLDPGVDRNAALPTAPARGPTAWWVPSRPWSAADPPLDSG